MKPELPEHNFGMVEGKFAEDLVGKSFLIIQGKDIKVGDVLIDFNCLNFSHQTPATITKAAFKGDFVLIKWNDGTQARQYSVTCLFGKLTGG